MPISTRYFLLFLFLGLFTRITAQTLTLSYQNPDNLFVCGTDDMSVTIQSSGSTASNVQPQIKLPAGVRYVAGTVTGASELNVSDLNAPVFKLADIGSGASATFSLQVEATCVLINQINSGVQFSNDISVTYNGGNTQITTSKYIIETGFLVFDNITPSLLTGEYGQMLTRTITVKNTRLGSIGSLRFTDEHIPGYDLSLMGLSGNNTTTFFEADIPGSYFTGFGDGDNLFEKDEVITFTEKLTITDCGFPPVVFISKIRLAWGCTADPECQIVEEEASVLVTQSSLNPSLVLTPDYAEPNEVCPNEGILQHVTVANYGGLAATNVSIQPYVIDTGFIAIDPNSFEYNDGSGWQPLPPATGVPTEYIICGPTPYLLEAATVLPTIAPNDSIQVRFRTFVCLGACTSKSPRLRVRFRYPKKCPIDQEVVGASFMAPDLNAELRSSVEYSISHCLNDGETYNFTFKVRSSRLLNGDNGYIQTIFNVPKGLIWDPTCAMNLNGKAPESVTFTPQAQSTQVKLVYKLPFTADTAVGIFCLKYVCDGDMPCADSIPNPPPPGEDYTVFPPGTLCDGCKLYVTYNTILGETPEQPFDCSIATCGYFVLTVNNTCGAGGGGGGGGGGGVPGLALASVDSYRINYGLKDDNDDRKADSNLPATKNLIRLDRFMPGDTIRTDMKAVVISGGLSKIDLRVFHEIWSSDFGVNDGDGFFFPLGKGFVNKDLLSYVRSSVTVKLASGASYTCPLSKPVIQSDQHIYTIAIPNVEPPAIQDNVLNMFDEYSIDLAALSGTPGCPLPANTVLGVGDSLYFQTENKFNFNFVPMLGASNIPALINFRNTICGTDNVYAWKLTGCFEPKMRQYTGYQEKATPSVYEISPCDTTEARDPFIYSIRLARPNLFPFEVRPLTKMKTYRQSFPNIVPHFGSQLNFLALQESTPFLGKTPLTVSINSGQATFNLTPLYQQVLDEGYNFELSSKFGKACSYSGVSALSTKFTMTYPNLCFHNPIQMDYSIDDPKGITSGSAELAFIPSEIIVELTSENLDYDFVLRNNTNDFAANGYIIVDSDNKLTNVQLFVVTPTGQQPIPQVNGVFQLGDIDPFKIIDFKMTAISQICEDIQVTFRYGWDCDPVTSLSSNPCGQYTKVITISPSKPELELDILVQPDNIPMCQPSGFIEFEIYNADEGVASNTEASVKLPPGLIVVPGSSSISYPAGSAYTPMADPLLSTGNVWNWNPEAASAELAQNGLLGIQEDPKNAFKIRFKVQPTCGFVANTQIVYGAEAIQPCGSAANLLRKPGDPIQVNGLTPSYSAISNLSFSNPPGNVACSGNTELTATITLGDAPSAGDSIYIILPLGTSYENGSYTGVLNAPTGQPQLSGHTLQLPFPTNVGAGSTVSFRFKVKYDEPAGCVDKIVVLQTREKESLFCATTNSNCDVYIATSEVFLTLNALNPQLRALSFNADQNGSGTVNFSMDVENIGNGQASNPTVQFYLDLNGNGKVDPTDQLVTTVNGSGNIPAGGLFPITGSMNLSAADLCKLLAFFPAGSNCACDDATYPLAAKSTISYAIGKCAVGPVNVGITQESGHSYSWAPSAGITCTTCSNTVFTPGLNVSPGELVTLVLEDKSGTGCTVLHRFEIQFGLSNNLNIPDQKICKGESAILEAPPGGTYQWTWPTGNTATTQSLVVTPDKTTTYRVTVTYADGCTGVGDSKITVLKQDTLIEAKRETCKGSPVNILGMTTDVPGIYTKVYLNINGCDSLVTQELVVIPNQISFTKPLCPGDSLMVKDSLFTSAGQLCYDSTGGNNCQIQVCINVVQVDNPNLPSKDPTVITLGNSAVLDVPDGLAVYSWTPIEWLSCSDCADPVVTPVLPPNTDSTKTYGLFVRDGNGCTDTISYRVVVFPPCEPGRLQIPNAFTPDGDGVNDLFQVHPFEGFESINSLSVYNRWGNKVWSGNGLTDGWNGTVDGKPAPADVYVWVLEVSCGEEGQKIKGDITLLR